jgi:hypothetical protein
VSDLYNKVARFDWLVEREINNTDQVFASFGDWRNEVA